MSVREQRRLVTVLFADVVGSTALAEELDAEDVRALLTRYYALANDVVTAHGGIVAKLLGDGVLACFGIPAAHGDDAQRALDAALALCDGVRGDAALQRLQLRVGVNTGEVLANEDATGEIVGDAVNVAARVAAAAGEGEVLAADATHRAAAAIAYGDAREIAAKGKAQPVRVWPVVGRAAEREGARTPFVGRDDDLAQLELVARRAFRDRRPYLVTITAPTGTGKSRLVHEFRERLGAETRYAHAHCPPYGQSLAFSPLRELLVGLIGVSKDAPPDDVRAHIGAVLGGDADRDALLIAMTVAPEGGLDEQERESVFAAWRRLLVRLAEERPMLVVLEDLQYAADSVLDLVEQIAQPGVAAPLLVVCIARPELLARRPSWGGGRRNSLNLALEPLRDDEIALLVSSLLETEPPPVLRDRIVERGAGNPFFAEELVRALIERGPLDLRDGAALERALAALPETVQATVLARIDMLPAEERTVVQSAAIVGRSFDAALLTSICEHDPPSIDAALARLAERELVTRADDGSYDFRNALVRDVAYGMLPRARRARDHALIARRLESTAGDRVDERASLIALHYLEATRLRRASAVPVASEAADVEAARAAAVVWLSRASRINAATGAWAESIKQLEDALALATTDDEKIPLLMQLTETTSGGDIGWDAGTEALRLWRTQPDGDPALGARIIVDLLVLLLRSGVSISPDRHPDHAAQEALAAEALALARRSGDELVLAGALVTHAYFERAHSGRTQASLEAARTDATQAAEILERRGEWLIWSMALDAWAAIEGDLGDLRRGREIAARRLERLDRLYAIERPHAHWTMPLYTIALGEIDEALRHIEAAYAEPAFVKSRWAYNSIVGQVFILSWRAAAHWALGRWDDVVADAREGLVVLGGIGAGPMRSVFDHAAAAALYLAGRREREDLVAEITPALGPWTEDERVLALRDDDPSHLDGALERVTTAGIDTWQVERSLSVLAAYGRVPVPATALDPLVRYAEERGLRPMLAQLLRLRARAAGSVDDARRAHVLLSECGMRADAALAGVEMAALGDRSQLAASRAELERLGDVRGLAAADAL